MLRPEVEPYEGLIKELQDHVKNETAPYEYPRVIEFVEELPKTISGKIRRVKLREMEEKSMTPYSTSYKIPIENGEME